MPSRTQTKAAATNPPPTEPRRPQPEQAQGSTQNLNPNHQGITRPRYPTMHCANPMTRTTSKRSITRHANNQQPNNTLHPNRIPPTQSPNSHPLASPQQKKGRR